MIRCLTIALLSLLLQGYQLFSNQSKLGMTNAFCNPTAIIQQKRKIQLRQRNHHNENFPSHVLRIREKYNSAKSSSSRLLMEPLAQEGSWAAYLDDQTTGLVYYFNAETGESLWEPPSATFPAIMLDANQRDVAQAKQQEYRTVLSTSSSSSESSTQKSTETGGGFPFFGSRKISVSTVSESSDNSVTTNKPTPSKEATKSKESKDAKEFDKSVNIGGEFPFFGSGKKSDERSNDGIQTNKNTRRLGAGLLKTLLGRSNSQGDDPSVVSASDKVPPSSTDTRKSSNASTEASKVPTNLLTTNDNTSSSPPTKKFWELPFTNTETPKSRTSASVNTESVSSASSTKFRERNIQTVETAKDNDISSSASSSTAPTTSSPSFPATLELDVAAYVLPHPAKVRWGGEDAVFVKGRTFGVLDGVSGADKLDGVPLYSLTLAKELKASIPSREALSVPELTRALTKAAEFADQSATGASTAVVASLSESGTLYALNVGDSVCIVIRDGKVVAKTKDLIHYFDCPYQLSEDSPDRPKDGTKLVAQVQKGDFVVMGSDGIFDNLPEQSVAELVQANRKLRAAALTRKIVEQSRRVSLDSSAVTPYAKLAKRNGDPDYSSGRGGKVDDASCIVVKCL